MAIERVVGWVGSVEIQQYVSVCIYVTFCLSVYVYCCFAVQMRNDIAYANSKGIEVGGYDLIVLTRGGVPDYYHAVGGDGTCMASSWSVAFHHLSVGLLTVNIISDPSVRR